MRKVWQNYLVWSITFGFDLEGSELWQPSEALTPEVSTPKTSVLRGPTASYKPPITPPFSSLPLSLNLERLGFPPTSTATFLESSPTNHGVPLPPSIPSAPKCLPNKFQKQFFRSCNPLHDKQTNVQVIFRSYNFFGGLILAKIKLQKIWFIVSRTFWECSF